MKFTVFVLKLMVFLLLFVILDFSTSKLMLRGLNKFYEFNCNPKILINGSSMSLAGFNKSELEKKTNQKISLYAKEGVGVEDRLAMLEHFFSEHPNTVKIAIYEINPLLFSNKLTAANVYSIFYPFMDNKAIDQYIYKRADRMDYLVHKYDNLKTVSLNPAASYFKKSEENKIQVELNKDKVVAFEKSIRLLEKNKVKTVVVMMPIYYQKQLMFDSLSYKRFVSYFKECSALNKNVSYFDANTDSFSRNALLFSDLVHLNREGQRKITEIFGEYLKKSMNL
jgi:hypothetical protein